MANETLNAGDRLHGFFREGGRGRPQWVYPELRDSGTNENLSSVAFDLLICIGISLVTLVSLAVKFGYQNAFLLSLKTRLDSVTRDTSREPVMKGAFREVSHIRKESFFVWFSVMTAIAFVVFKILTGSKEADAGQIFLILLVALFAKMLRQQTSVGNTFKMLMSLFSTVFAIVACYVGYIGYSKSDHFYQQDKPNSWYIACVVLGTLAMVSKTVQTIFEDNMSTQKMKDEKNKSKMSGEYLYPLCLIDVIVFSLVTIAFFCFEGIVIARADTKLYAVAFWALWVLPIYCIVMQIIQAAVFPSNVLAVIFNIIMALHVLGIVLLGQMQVCSIFSVESDAPFTELTQDATVVTKPIGCPARWGLYQNNDHMGIAMHKSAIWVLAVITSLFITFVYSGASFTLHRMDERIAKTGLRQTRV
jgi:hypothetical protein